MNGRVHEGTRWGGGVTRFLAGWLDSARDGVGEDVGVHAVKRESRGVRAQVDLEKLARQEEIKLVQGVFLAPGSKRRAVLFAGVERDNGCARICIRAGETLARLAPQSVCVVDANLRAPVLHEVLGRDNDDGMAAAIGHPGTARTCARQLGPDNLWLLPSGSAPASDPDLLLTADRVQPWLHELGTSFDRIVINAPPIDLYAESLALSQFVDGVVLVLEANVTRREIVRNVKTRLDDLDVPLLGIVLNNRTFPIPDAVYRLL